MPVHRLPVCIVACGSVKAKWTPSKLTVVLEAIMCIEVNGQQEEDNASKPYTSLLMTPSSYVGIAPLFHLYAYRCQ